MTLPDDATDRDLLLALPTLLPEQLQAAAQGFVDQVLAACDLAGLAIDLEAILGAWDAVVRSTGGYPVLAAMLAEAGGRTSATPAEVWQVLDAMERFEATQEGEA